MSSGTQSVSTNASPATTIRSAPATRTRRRPKRSAWVVSQSEISVSPTSVSVSTIPIVRASSPSGVEVEDQDDGEEPVPEHAERPHREEQTAVAVEAAQARDESRVGCLRLGWPSLPSLRGATTPERVCQNAAGGTDPIMSADAHESDAPGHPGAVEHHLPDDHGDDHGHDDHAHGEEALGPIDVAAWGAGAGIGLVIAGIVIDAPRLTLSRPER